MLDCIGVLQACCLFHSLHCYIWLIILILISCLQVCKQLAAMVSGPGLGPALTASDVATALKVPVPIAAEHLSTAELAAVLCRDDGPEGLRFYRNFFRDGVLAT